MQARKIEFHPIWIRLSSPGNNFDIPGTHRPETLTGEAAGIAATFNAPIAGSMFALEIILGDFGLATFSPIVISAVMATAVSRHFLGDVPAFIVPKYHLVSFYEFPLYIFLGLLCAGVGVAFTRSLYKTEDIFDGLRFPPYLKACLGGLVLGGLALGFPQVLGVGYGAIDRTLAQAYTWWFLILLIPAKILATSVTISSGGSGGIFAPSLLLGALTGGASAYWSIKFSRRSPRLRVRMPLSVWERWSAPPPMGL
jgi:CIC family chloride channel protein